MARYIDLIGEDDCPHLQPPHWPAEEKDGFYKGLPPHEREARRTGKPSLGAGAIYPVAEKNFLVEPFRIPDWYERGWALDVGWNRTAALFACKDPDTGIMTLTDEYYRSELEPVVHAHGISAIMPWPRLRGAIDPAAEGSNQKDGSKLIVEYQSLGLELIKANNAVAAGIHHVLTLLQTGMLQVFDTLKNWLKEYRLYRRDEKGKIVKKNDHLMDCTRYVTFTDGLFATLPQQNARRGGGGEW